MIRHFLIPEMRWEIAITHRPRVLDVEVIVRGGIRAPLVQDSTYRHKNIRNPVDAFEFQQDLLEWAEYLSQETITWEQIQNFMSPLQETGLQRSNTELPRI